MDKITNNFFHSQTNSTTELGHSPPFLDLSRKLLVNGFLIMINYIYIQLYNLQGWFVMVSECEVLVGLLTGDQSGGTQIYCPQYIKPVLYTLP